MSKLPRVSGEKVVKALTRAKFQRKRQKGSHVILRKKKIVVVVPLHKELDRGTLKEIIRQSKIQREEFLSLLR